MVDYCVTEILPGWCTVSNMLAWSVWLHRVSIIQCVCYVVLCCNVVVMYRYSGSVMQAVKHRFSGQNSSQSAFRSKQQSVSSQSAVSQRTYNCRQSGCQPSSQQQASAALQPAAPNRENVTHCVWMEG